MMKRDTEKTRVTRKDTANNTEQAYGKRNRKTASNTAVINQPKRVKVIYLNCDLSEYTAAC